MSYPFEHAIELTSRRIRGSDGAGRDLQKAVSASVTFEIVRLRAGSLLNTGLTNIGYQNDLQTTCVNISQTVPTSLQNQSPQSESTPPPPPSSP